MNESEIRHRRSLGFRLVSEEEEYLNDRENESEILRFADFRSARTKALELANQYKCPVAVVQTRLHGQLVKLAGERVAYESWHYTVTMSTQSAKDGGTTIPDCVLVSIVHPGAPIAWSVDGPVR